jgi:hypothetical protein
MVNQRKNNRTYAVFLHEDLHVLELVGLQLLHDFGVLEDGQNGLHLFLHVGQFLHRRLTLLRQVCTISILLNTARAKRNERRWSQGD